MTSYHKCVKTFTPGQILTRSGEYPDTPYAHDPIAKLVWTTREAEGLINKPQSTMTAGFSIAQTTMPFRDLNDPGSQKHPLDMRGFTPPTKQIRFRDDTSITVF